MANIIFTKGAPGSGKSTFIKKHNLESYTLSPDTIRLLHSSPVLSLEGEACINAANDRKVWNMLFQLLESRMQNGEFIIVDATHTKPNDLKAYKNLVDKNRYRAYCLDFSDVTLQECLDRNAQREDYKRVKDEVIIKMHERSLKSTIPSWVKNIEKKDFKSWIGNKQDDLSKYQKVYHIGDIQGCFSVLKEFFDKNPIEEKNFYIFTGDYVDRGIENHLAVEFLLNLFENHTNFVFLEGNHDRYLWQWASNQAVKTKEFHENTAIQLNENNIQKPRVRNFCRHLRQYFYYSYNNLNILVTHAGLPLIPKYLKTVSDRQFMHGTGEYSQSKIVDDLFVKQTNSSSYSIHGHRNVDNHAIQINNRCYNLEGEVEHGGNLRIVVVSKVGIEQIEVKNKVFKKVIAPTNVNVNYENKKVIDKLRNNKYINEKNFGNISSFNFTKKAFYNKIWNEQTIKSRGLFVNNNTYEIVARSYEKFFNINEMDFTEYTYLAQSMNYPVEVYRKENGYLGMLGFDVENDEFVFATKSMISGQYQEWFKDIFMKRYDSKLEEIKAKLVAENLCLVFEVIHPANDPHIIEYSQEDLILLDAIKRKINFEKYAYTDLELLAKEFGFNIKTKQYQLKDKSAFELFYKKSIEMSVVEESTEGFVLEDSNGFMVKLKLPYYSFWKKVRSYIENKKLNPNARVKQEMLKDPVFNLFKEWIDAKSIEYLDKSLIELRRMFLDQVSL